MVAKALPNGTLADRNGLRSIKIGLGHTMLLLKKIRSKNKLMERRPRKSIIKAMENIIAIT